LYIKIDIKEHWLIITSLFVTIFSTIGFIYSYFYYGEFGINYLNHAEITDLFSVLFVHPMFFISLLLFLSSFFSLGILGLPERHQIPLKYEKVWGLGTLHKNRFTIFGLVAFVAIMSSSIWLIKGKILKIKSFKYPIHQISYNRDKIIQCAVSIGSTSTSLFYWNIESSEAFIIPKRNIVKINIIIPEVPHRYGRGQKPPRDGSKTEYQKTLIKWNNEIKKKCYSAAN
jgi:hypothetical protein